VIARLRTYYNVPIVGGLDPGLEVDGTGRHAVRPARPMKRVECGHDGFFVLTYKSVQTHL